MRIIGEGVRVYVVDVSDVEIVRPSPRIGVDESTGGVQASGQLDHPGDVEGLLCKDLPAILFVEYRPLYYGGMIPPSLYRRLHILHEQRDRIVRRRPAVLLGQILKHNDSRSIGVIIPPFRIDLLMKAYEVHPELRDEFHVVRQRFVRRGGVQTVRPEGLIEYSREEDWAAVQRRTEGCVGGRIGGGRFERAEAKVGEDDV
mmetsp:Transcript_43608/g.132719  ORF Transcript_43608/g.132719 Transcript_43608/m.132719 type:complete len:201 (-) Transcript_43608:705-1307(-)